jgi:hypothetical protein
MVANTRVELNVDGIAGELRDAANWLIGAAETGMAAHDVERGVFRKILEMGRQMFGAFLEMVGTGDLGETITLPDGRVVRRLGEPRARELTTVFGRFAVSRCVYGTEEHQAFALVPTDSRLQLPEGNVSYLLQEWDQLLGIDQAFSVARDTLNTILRIKQSVDTLEHGSRQMAEAAPAFRAQQAAPDPAEEGELLIVTEDNKGVPMVRPTDAPPPGAHLTKGQKKNKKKMACIGAVYSVDRHVRTPEELVQTLFRDEDRPRLTPPKATQKRYWASLTRTVEVRAVEDDDVSLVEICGQTEVFQHLRDDILLRRQPGQTLVHLSDGQVSLETDRNKYFPCDEQTLDILDLLHVLPRLWDAAHLFHKEASPEAIAFVRRRLLRVLQGQAKSVIADLRSQGTKRGLAGSAKVKLRTLTGFLESNLHRMKYDEYLAAGCPIATGVIEGACRHLVKDRMERSGMRWKIPGAQAMLTLRAVRANGDWETFQDFRIRHETQRLHPPTRQLQSIHWPLTPTAV